MFNKLIKSSSDPTKVAATFKGFAIMAGGIILNLITTACAFGVYCVNVDQTFINTVVDSLTNIVFLGVSLVGAVYSFYGLIRKVKLGRWTAAK